MNTSEMEALIRQVRAVERQMVWLNRYDDNDMKSMRVVVSDDDPQPVHLPESLARTLVGELKLRLEEQRAELLAKLGVTA